MKRLFLSALVLAFSSQALAAIVHLKTNDEKQATMYHVLNASLVGNSSTVQLEGSRQLMQRVYFSMIKVDFSSQKQAQSFIAEFSNSAGFMSVADIYIEAKSCNETVNRHSSILICETESTKAGYSKTFLGL